MRNKFTLICFLIIFTNCKNNKNRIEHILHKDSERLWGVYSSDFKSKNISYRFYKMENKCITYNERNYGDDGSKYNISNRFSNTWGIDVSENEIYLRCMFDCYKVLNYNEKCFKLLTQKGDTIYLCDTTCQSNDGLIPETVDPAPF